MGTEVALQFDNELYKQLGLIPEENSGGSWGGPPRLMINTTAEDEEDNPLPVGAYHIVGTDLYAKEIKFRITGRYFQYIKYDEDFKVVGWTQLIPSMNYEALDTDGGERCGRPIGDAFKELSDAEQETFRKYVPVFVHLFGVAYFPDGPEEGVFCDFRCRGGNITEVFKLFDTFDSRKFNPINYEVSLSTKKGKKGNNVYYNTVMDPIITKQPLDIVDIKDAVKETLDFVASENTNVLKKHKEALDTRSNGEKLVEESKVIEGTATTVVDAELDDEIPF